MKRLMIFAVSILASAPLLFASSDWIEPGPATKYDWRHTNWFGANIGSAGGGLSFQHWGESSGFQASILPAVTKDDSWTGVLGLGGAYMSSINKAKPSAAGEMGFTSTHFYWFAGAYAGIYVDHDWVYDSGTGKSTADVSVRNSLIIGSAGLGLDLNRRDSRWTIKVGFGPYDYYDSYSGTELKFLPTIEIGWHFGVPQRKAP